LPASPDGRVDCEVPAPEPVAASAEAELIAEETAATNEGMPAGESDEQPKAAAASE